PLRSAAAMTFLASSSVTICVSFNGLLNSTFHTYDREWSRRSAGADAGAASCQLPGHIPIHKLPIDEVAEKRGDVVETPMLIVQVVRVLPHINRQQRHLFHGERRVRIGRRGNAQAAVLEHEPSPAATELIAGDRDELLPEGSLAPKRFFDQLCTRPARVPAATRTHASPIKLVIPRLRGRIEER